jgi:hypothetical protein
MILKVEFPHVKIKKKGNPYNVTCCPLEIVTYSARIF